MPTLEARRAPILTNMPLGVVKIILIKLHAFVEMLAGPVLFVGALAVPTLVTGGRGFFIAAGTMIFAVWLLSYYGLVSELR